MPKKILRRALPKAGSKESYQNILLEEMNSKFDLMMEKLVSHDEQFDRIGVRFDNLERKVDINSLKIDQNRFEIVKISLKFDQHEKRISRLESRA
jgi:hypothetical protein